MSLPKDQLPPTFLHPTTSVAFWELWLYLCKETILYFIYNRNSSMISLYNWIGSIWSQMDNLEETHSLKDAWGHGEPECGYLLASFSDLLHLLHLDGLFSEVNTIYLFVIFKLITPIDLLWFFEISGSGDKWLQGSVFVQNLFIFASGLVYKFGRSEDLWG